MIDKKANRICGSLSCFMRVHIEKKLRVQYSAPVRDCVRRLRVLPAPGRDGSVVRDLQWHVFPKPDSAGELTDDFGNRILALRHTLIERELRFHLKLEMEAHPCPPGNKTGRSPGFLPETGIGAFLLPSALCDLGPRIREAAAEFKSLSQQDLPQALCEYSFRSLRYEPQVSGTETTASQALARGGGVCQDFAHLMIALCRASALPARYISGYAPGEGRMHAWVEVLCQDEWQAWDPTHNRVARPESVVVAIGRDFRDANPHEGTFQGRAHAVLHTWCKTTIAGFQE